MLRVTTVRRFQWNTNGHNHREILSQTKDKFENIKPIIEDILKRNIGLSISELNNDITTKLHENPLINYNLNTNLKLKDAKKEFKKEFIKRVLSMNYGNISEVAKQIDVNRKTIHRLVEDYEIKNIRSFMEKSYSIKERAIGQVIEDVQEGYKEFIHPNKLEDIYGNIPSMTEDLIQTIPIKELTLEEAEEIFEKKFMTKVLNLENHNLKKTADHLGIRYETLLRKIKKLQIK